MAMRHRYQCLLTLLVAMLLPLNVSAVAQEFSRHRAIVIGIDDYDSGGWSRLGFAVADAKRVAGFLERSGYQVTLLVDDQASRENVLNALHDASRDLGEDDRLLFYFGGHGHTDKIGDDEHGYLVPHGAKSVGGMIAMDEIRELSSRMRAVRHQLFVLNSCYGGTIGVLRGVRGLNADRPQYLTEITRRQARQFVAAGGPDQQVLDGGPDGLSWFTHFLLEAVEKGEGDLDGDGYVTFPELNAYLIPRASNQLQTPTYGALPGHALGEYIFAIPRPGSSGAGEVEVAVVEPPKITTTETRSLTAVAQDFEVMQEPIHRLYEAWESLDLNEYGAQWAENAVQYVGRKKRSKRQIMTRRAKLFPRLASVDVERYQVWFRGYENGVASFDASYTMSFYFRDGRVLRESERETYRTRHNGERWVIVENRDYLR